MDFTLTAEQQMFRDSVRGFAERHLADGALQRAHAEGYPWEIAQLMGAQGLLGITFDPADGGQGGSMMDAVLAIEEVAAVCPRSADVIQSGNFGPIRTFSTFATKEQKRRFLPSLLAGRSLIAIGMTEPEAGSAVTDLKTTATPDGDGFRVDGTKVFTTNSPDATLFLIYVRFGPGVSGIGSVLMERDTPGLSFGRPSRFVGGDHWRQLYFEGCRVPAENVLLPAGGFKRQMSGFNAERLGNTARSLAVGRLAFEIARKHAMDRRQFGRPLAEFQGLQWKFAEMAMQLDAGQLLLYRAAANADRGLPSEYDTAVAKAFCNKAGFDVANEALQVLGGLGYTEDSLVEYCARRARGWMIAGGSIEILKNRIAESVFGRRFPQRRETRDAAE
ncbi:MAG: acyl-CoA dehydrogenase family protein [Alphaproteobacteria bacterium]|nr:acyl-CoA dehydrogenase family protein [Alphaproteobacteria bacterium]